jgi:hypothetical protein
VRRPRSPFATVLRRRESRKVTLRTLDAPMLPITSPRPEALTRSIKILDEAAPTDDPFSEWGLIAIQSSCTKMLQS